MDINLVLIIIVRIVVLAFSVIVHEVAHAYVAYRLGDTTAHDENRITLNPLPHIDLMGSIVIPLVSIYSPVMIGWAKPVPVNPIYFQNPKSGMMWVSLAGPGSNLGLAVLGGILFRLVGYSFGLPVAIFLRILCLTNIILAVFNMLPIPPLDGSKVVARFMPTETAIRYLQIQQFGFFIVIGFLLIDQQFQPGLLSFLVDSHYGLLTRLLLGSE
jgi:Zn-dependent protease